MPTDLSDNAWAFLHTRFPDSYMLTKDIYITDNKTGNVIHKACPFIVIDFHAAVKQRAIVVPDVGPRDDLADIASCASGFFADLDKTTVTQRGHQRGHPIDTTQMPFAPRIIIYVNSKRLAYRTIMNSFKLHGFIIDIINEAEMFKSAFISYGGTDESAAAEINRFLKSRGIKTWFFPDDALPGQKLHRMMHEGVNRHERVLLVCSQSALSRPGVLNELERVLEREAKEGGSDILIPVTLDDYVFGDWAPTRADVAAQVRSRVVTRLNFEPGKEDKLKAQLEKVVKALSKAPP